MHLLAAFDNEIAPMIASVMVFMIPIVAILTSHQRKMAQLIHGNPENRVPNGQDHLLRAELADLRSRIDNLTLAIEQMRTEQKAGSLEGRLSSPPPIEQR